MEAAAGTKLRPSDREELAARRADLTRRLEGFERDHGHNRDRLETLSTELTEALTEKRAAAEVAAQAEAAAEKVRMNYEVVSESLERLDERIEAVKGELQEVERLIGQRRPSQPQRSGASEDEALKVASRFGTFGEKDLASALKVKPRAASELLAKLVERGAVKDLGTKVLGQRMFEYVPTDEQQEESVTEAKHLVRDWICSQRPGQAFTRVQVKAATETTDEEVDSGIKWAVERSMVRNIGVEGAEIFEYHPPEDAGKGAVIDMARRARESVVVGSGGAPVAGTGRGLTISDPDVRALVQAVERLGATVTRAGDGHFKVSYNGKSANIASTPRNRRTVLNDRARIRRTLGLNLAS